MSAGKLPEGWVGSKLGDVVDVNSGIGFPIKYQGKSSGDYPVYKVRDISSAVARNNGNLNIAGHYVSAKEAVELRGKIFRSGTTVFAKIGEAVRLNRRAIIQTSGLADNNVMAISAILHEMDKFIFHFMNTIDLSEQARSTTVPSIRKGDVENILLSLPPLAEQKIIAEKLDTLLAQVDSTKARLEQIPQILKRFRQAVLVSAVEGRLNNFDSKKWKLTKIENLVRIVNGKSFPSTDYQNNGVKLLRPGNLHKSGTVIWTDKNTTYLPKHWVIKRPELSLKGGALLMNLTAQSLKDEFLGRVCILNESDEVILLNQRISAFTSNVKYNVIPYLFIYFKSPQFRSYIDTLDSGTLIKHLNIKNIKSYSLKLPSEEEQAEIVRRVEQLFAYADTIEKQVNNALARVNNLTQSILAKAFRGELTAQWRAENPELISGENSAAALLEKVKAERAACGGKKPRVKNCD